MRRDEFQAELRELLLEQYEPPHIAVGFNGARVEHRSNHAREDVLASQQVDSAEVPLALSAGTAVQDVTIELK